MLLAGEGSRCPGQTLSPSVPLLGSTHHSLGAFYTEEGFISWAGCPEWVDLLGLGSGEEKVGSNEEAAGRSTQCPGTPSPVATLSPALGGMVPGEFPAASSRESPPAYTAFACQTPLCSQSLCLGLYVSAPLQVGWGLGWGSFCIPQPSIWVGRGSRAMGGP